MARILLVEDDPRIVSFIRRGLEAEGHVIDTADTAVRGLNMARENDYPLLILDRMLPDMDGVEICRQLRQERVDSRILMLTARDTLDDKVGGLRAGADDYLTNPFSFDEFVARIEACSVDPACSATGRPSRSRTSPWTRRLAPSPGPGGPSSSRPRNMRSCDA